MGRLALTAWLVLALILVLLFSVSVRLPPEPSPAASEPASAALRQFPNLYAAKHDLR